MLVGGLVARSVVEALAFRLEHGFWSRSVCKGKLVELERFIVLVEHSDPVVPWA